MNDDYPYFKGIDDIENMSNEEYQKLSYDEKVIVWTTFYRKNPHRFVEHYLGIRLHFFQKIMIYLMFKFPYVILLCSRAVSKSFTTTITACAICLLYPNSKVLVTAFTKQQAALLITEKLQKELLGLSPILDEEIFNIKTGVNNTEVIFKNGSSFITSVSGEGARGLRSTVLVIDEFRLVKEDDLNAILIPTMIPRQAPYLMKQQYQHMSQQPKRIMLSSAYYKAHWMWDAIRLAAKGSYNGTAALFSTDYFTTIKHGIKKREQMIEAKNATDELNWLMEYCNICVGGAENQYYSYDLIGNAQVLKRAFYPRTSDEYLSTTKKDKNGIRVKTGSWFGEIPKTKDELRVVSMDVAYSKDSRKTKNDYTVIKCIRAIPNKGKYERQEVYTERFQGVAADEQTLRLKQIFDDFQGDYIVLDTVNAGTHIVDELGKVTDDAERDTQYGAIRCFNSEKVAERCRTDRALDVLYAFEGSAQRNEDMHRRMKASLIDGTYKMLIPQAKCEDEWLKSKAEFKKGSTDDRIRYRVPYVESDNVLGEMINLTQEWINGNRNFRLVEPSTGTKDSYMTTGMANYFIQEKQLELYDEEEGFDENDVYVMW